MACRIYRIELHNLDGLGPRRCHVYDVPAATDHVPDYVPDFWGAVTDVPCPACDNGIVRWAEAGYVPGYRVCQDCGRHYLAGGTALAPTLIRVGSRRSTPPSCF